MERTVRKEANLETYQRQIAIHEGELKRWQSRFHLLGYGKLCLLAALAGSLYVLYRQGAEPPYLLVTGALLLATVAAWLYHIRVHERVDLHRGLIEINRQYLDRMEGKWTGFSVRGEEFGDPDHPFGADLDIVGPKSLFQMLNVAHTWHGRSRFAADLLAAGYGPREIRARQAAVQDLAERCEFTNLFQYHTRGIGADRSVERMTASLADPAGVIPSRLACGLLLWAPVMVSLLSGVVFGFGIKGLYLPAVILLAGQGLFWVLGLPRTNRYLSEAAAFPYIFRHYAKALDLLGGEDFQAALLQEIQRELATGGKSAAKAIRELDSIVSKVHMKNSGVLYFVANVFLLWDYRCAVQLSRWKAAYGPSCEGWFQALGDFESLLSLAGLPNVCFHTCMPQIEEEGRCVSARQLGHPLLANDSRVCNDMALTGGMWIISGSNMSGKTTFLRTVGVNLILARAGGAVCAGEMRCSLFRVMASMRIADDLSGGISTFYAELRQIAAISEGARRNPDLFFLIDEIFRGTNSEDRLFGAAAVIRELAGRDVMGMITTHDLTLCDLEEESGGIRNYSFSERYEGEEMRFDYRLEPGRSRTTNARFLMRKVGILRDGDAAAR